MAKNMHILCISVTFLAKSVWKLTLQMGNSHTCYLSLIIIIQDINPTLTRINDEKVNFSLLMIINNTQNSRII